jgi:hypothetical protein
MAEDMEEMPPLRRHKPLSSQNMEELDLAKVSAFYMAKSG